MLAHSNSETLIAYILFRSISNFVCIKVTSPSELYKQNYQHLQKYVTIMQLTKNETRIMENKYF